MLEVAAAVATAAVEAVVVMAVGATTGSRAATAVEVATLEAAAVAAGEVPQGGRACSQFLASFFP